jgi:hypothetical protein
MIGAWAGRQAEEELAQGFNRLLVDRVWDVWEKGKKDGRSSEFVDLSDPKLDDLVKKEAWALFPAETRDYIRQKFGNTGFMVRRDQRDAEGGGCEDLDGRAWPLDRQTVNRAVNRHGNGTLDRRATMALTQS